VGARYPVLIGEVLADTDRDRFLARVQMGESRDLARLDFDVQAFLELADGLHLPVGAEKLVT
jgi:hypothetical protein